MVIEGTDGRPTRGTPGGRSTSSRASRAIRARLPRQFAPYHLRLDWLMWFAALSPAYAQAWFGTLVERLLENDRATLRLLRRSPFPPTSRPATSAPGCTATGTRRGGSCGRRGPAGSGRMCGVAAYTGGGGCESLDGAAEVDRR